MCTCLSVYVHLPGMPTCLCDGARLSAYVHQSGMHTCMGRLMEVYTYAFIYLEYMHNSDHKWCQWVTYMCAALYVKSDCSMAVKGLKSKSKSKIINAF